MADDGSPTGAARRVGVMGELLPSQTGPERPETSAGPAQDPAEGDRPRSRTDHLVAWAVLRRPDGSVLLARRAGVGYGQGRWGLPGGHVEDHETLAAAAAREAREEVGVGIDPADLRPIGMTRYVDGDARGTDHYFVTSTWTGVPAAVSECDAVTWADPQALPPDALPWLGQALGRHLLDGIWWDDHPEH